MATILPQILGDNVNIPSKSSGCPLGLRPSGHPSLLSGILTLFPLDFREYFVILLGDVKILLQSVMLADSVNHCVTLVILEIILNLSY